MTKYVITGPDGKKYNVTGDGTPEEALAAFEAQLSLQTPKATVPPVPPVPEEPSLLTKTVQGIKDLAQGSKASIDRTALGIKGLLPQAVQDFGDSLDRRFGSDGLTTASATKAPDSFMGKVGDVGTDIGLSLIPGNAALKAGNVVKQGLALTRAAKLAVPVALAVDTGINAGAAAGMAPEDRSGAATSAAVGNLIGAGASRVLGGALRNSVSPEAKTLMDSGVQLTPGQALTGPQAGLVARTLRDTEDKITSIPILGDVIKGAQGQSLKSFNQVQINAALAPLGHTVNEAGINGLKKADDLISSSYDSVLPHISVDSNAGLGAVIQARMQAMQHPLFDVGHENKFDMFVDRRLMPVLSQGQAVDGATVKALDSELGELGRKYLNGGVGNEPLGEAFMMLRREWRQAMQGATPEARQTLRDADQAYAKLLPLQEAGAKTSSGIFGPKTLADQLRKMHAPEDPLAQAGRQVLPSAIPDSGTAGRTILANMLHPVGLGAGLAGASGAAGFAAPAVAALGASALYTKPGLRAATEGIHPLLQALRRGRPYDSTAVEDTMHNLIGRASAQAFKQ